MKQIPEALKAQFLRLYNIAFSDDNFHILELKMLYRFARDRGISEEDLNHLLLNPMHPTELSLLVPESIEEKISCLYQLCEMIWADDVVEDIERTALEKYIYHFGFKQENASDLANYLLQAVKDKKTLTNVLNELKENTA